MPATISAVRRTFLRLSASKSFTICLLEGFLGNAQTQMDNLSRRAGVDSPDSWGSLTASQMSAGVDVLPRHYVTLWEALGTMTTPDIGQSEWSID